VAELAEVVKIAEEEQVTLRLARLKPGVSATLARDGVLSIITEARIHPSVDQAVQAQLGTPSAPPEPTAE
jgi:SulP family sulfate permease